ncbi:Uncharacterised protein [Shigella sonnei]|nr:Uncharacterised protein [Escherichia coli]CSQ65062.1 Uncharacterised protein [Shigella sonnei]CSS64120.1 Uncharacterised protein [Shigella sonnei]CSZ13261.1 Uncharacterised protein [Shigella sonnei]
MRPVPGVSIEETSLFRSLYSDDFISTVVVCVFDASPVIPPELVEPVLPLEDIVPLTTFELYATLLSIYVIGNERVSR